MKCENCNEQRGPGPLLLIPIVALFGAILSIGGCLKRHHRKSERGDWHDRHWHGPGGMRGRGPEFGGMHGPGFGPGRQRIDPLSILERRYAKGEIDEDEFQRRRSVLRARS